MNNSNQENESQNNSLSKFEAHKLNLTSTVKGGNGATELASESNTVTSKGYTAGDDWDFHQENP